MLVFIAILFFLFDLYIFFALRATKIGFAKRRFFACLWWGYAGVLLVALYVSANYDIPLTYRSVILVAFFITAVGKFIFTAILLVDDFRRGGTWIVRRLFPRKTGNPSGPIPDPLPYRPKEGISRSEFLAKSGLLAASLPVFPLSWGMVSGGYDYRIRHQKLHLPNLPASFHGMRIAQISDVHSGSFVKSIRFTDLLHRRSGEQSGFRNA